MSYVNTFIAVASDCPVRAGTEPAQRAGSPTIARLEYELISAQPYQLSQEEVQFAVHVQRQGLAPDLLATQRAALWAAFFAKPMACLRASPLAKTYGWGLHFDGAGKVALVGMETPDYARLLNDPAIRQVAAMRSSRAGKTRSHQPRPT